MALYVILILVLVALLVLLAFYIPRYPKLKIPVQVVLSLGILLLAIMVYLSIMKPVRFNAEMDKRKAVVIKRLEAIRTAELAYKDVFGDYTANFDTLMLFVRDGRLPLVAKLSTLPDSLSEMPVSRQIEEGYLTFDTTYVSAYDSLFGKVENFKLEKLPFIPFSEGEKFQIETGHIEKGQVLVPVIYLLAKKEQYLKGLDEDFINRDYVKDIEMGSLSEPSTDGNWE